MTLRASPLALLLLLCVPAWAQDEGETPLEPGMLEVCPELNEAGPREKKQLLQLFFELDTKQIDPKTRERVRSLFDLKQGKDVAVLVRYLDSDGKVSCVSGLKAVFLAHRSEGLLWLLERYAAAPPPRRGRLIDVLSAFPELQVWHLLVKLLGDETTVPNPKAAQIAPPGYVDMRVCDYALRALAKRLRKVKTIKPPGDRTQRKVHSTTPMEVRNLRVQKLSAFLAGDEAYKTHLVGQPSLLDGDDTARARAVCERLGLPTR